MRILVASSNKKKHAELVQLAGELPIELVLPAQVALALPEVVEDGASFAENARKKALAFARASGLPAIADDSGLCVDALGDAPGIYSARYSGEEPMPDRDEQNNRKLLEALSGVPAARRAASFHCAICLATPDGEAAVVEGSWRGQIAFSLRGANGFGYDPLFLLPTLGKTSAELSPDEKRSRSHRGQAMRALRELLRARAR